MLYVLTKWQGEYIILGEKRLGELQMRSGHTFNKLMTLTPEVMEDLILTHPLTGGDLPIIVGDAVSSDYGSGIDAITPAHCLESLHMAYYTGLPKEGFVGPDGKFTNDLGIIYEGQSVLEPETNELITGMMREDDKLFLSYPYKNEFYQVNSTGERVILRSTKAWFL